MRHPPRSSAARTSKARARRGVPTSRRRHAADRYRRTRRERLMTNHPLAGRRDPTQDVGYADPQPRKGFFTDTSICIGCKACEVACKEWNNVPDDGLNLLGMSYDNTGSLGANTWRHVAFIEQNKPLGHQEPGLRGAPAGAPMSEVIGEQVAEAVQRTG